MSNPSMYSPSMYRPNQQQQYSSPMSSQPPRPSTRPPRAGYNAPYPYPRPRSSASKPNPTSNYSVAAADDDYAYNNSNYYGQSSPMQTPDDLYSSRNSTYASEANNSFSSCLDTSFNERSTSFNDRSTPFNERPTPFNERPAPFHERPITFNERPTSFNERSDYSGNGKNTNLTPIYSGNGKNVNLTPLGNYSNNYYGNSTGYGSYSAPGSANLQHFNSNSIGKAALSQVQPVGEQKSFKNTFEFGRNNFKKRMMKRKAPSNEPPRRCDLCSLDFTSQATLDMHLSGSKHSKKLKAMDTLKQLQLQGQAPASDKITNVFHCDLCNVSLNSALQLQTHFDGAKHKNKLKDPEGKNETVVNTQQNGKGAVKAEPVAVPDEQKGSKLGRFTCDICNVIVNSQTQLQQHLESNKHKAKVEGKPITKKKGPKKQGDAKHEPMIVDDIPSNNRHGIPPLSATFVQKDTLH